MKVNNSYCLLIRIKSTIFMLKIKDSSLTENVKSQEWGGYFRSFGLVSANNQCNVRKY